MSTQTAQAGTGETLDAVLEMKNEQIPHEILSTEKTEGSRVRIDVRVPAETVNAKVEDVVKEFAKQASLPGFRPGKAPVALIRARYAKNAKDEAVRRMIPRLAELVGEEQKLENLAQPMYDGWKDDNGAVVATIVLEVRPEIALTDASFQGIEVEVTKGDVTDAAIDKEIEALRVRNAAFEGQEGAVFERHDGAALKVEVFTLEGEKIHSISGVREFSPTPEQQVPPAVYEALLGRKRGETAEVNSVEVNTQQGQKFVLNYRVTINDLRKRVLPAIDDEFAKDVSAEFQSLDDLRKRIRQELEDQREGRRRSETLAGIYAKLRERVTFDVPITLVRQLANRSVYRAEQQLRQYGTTLKKMGQGFVSNYLQKVQSDAFVEAKNMLLVEEAGRFLKVDVSEQDVNAEIERIATMQGRKPLAVRASLEADNRLADFKNDLRMKLVNDRLVSMATVKEVEPKAEEAAAPAAN